VTRAGLLSPGASFGAALSAGEARSALATLAVRLGVPAVDPGTRAPTVESFDRALVRELGLADVAAQVRAVAKAAGLAPPGRFGTEVVARYLGLRFNHPAADDRLELFPADPITRAEAAWSLAQLVGPDVAWRAQAARDTLSTFALPAYTAAQRQALTIAVSRIGFPYVWGGEADTTYAPLTGPQVHGGFDCSGLVWRVFKLSGLPAGALIRGRTAAQMAGEISKRERIALRDVAPGDILFFGSAGFRSRATEANVTHAAIALSPQWAINSSSQGVYVLPLTSGWLHDSFTWARRVL
jgi:cell wall-associated NlpC family hydrolase